MSQQAERRCKRKLNGDAPASKRQRIEDDGDVLGTGDPNRLRYGIPLEVRDLIAEKKEHGAGHRKFVIAREREDEQKRLGASLKKFGTFLKRQKLDRLTLSDAIKKDKVKRELGKLFKTHFPPKQTDAAIRLQNLEAITNPLSCAVSSVAMPKTHAALARAPMDPDYIDIDGDIRLSKAQVLTARIVKPGKLAHKTPRDFSLSIRDRRAMPKRSSLKRFQFDEGATMDRFKVIPGGQSLLMKKRSKKDVPGGVNKQVGRAASKSKAEHAGAVKMLEAAIQNQPKTDPAPVRETVSRDLTLAKRKRVEEPEVEAKKRRLMSGTERAERKLAGRKSRDASPAQKPSNLVGNAQKTLQSPAKSRLPATKPAPRKDFARPALQRLDKNQSVAARKPAARPPANRYQLSANKTGKYAKPAKK